MPFSRERIFPEREREREIQEGFKSAENFKREGGEVCPGYLNSALRGTSQWLS